MIAELGLPVQNETSSSAPGRLQSLNAPPAVAKSPRKPRAKKKPVTARNSKRLSHRSVLVVDDVADVTEMIALFLRHAGYDVTTANSAGTALELAGEHRFDLVISDIGMPEMNGYQLAESLRSAKTYQATPLIAVTGYTEYDDRGRSLNAGFNAHLTKPINPSQLLDLVDELLR